VRPGALIVLGLVCLVACVPTDDGDTLTDDAHPWSIRLAAFRYLESVEPFEVWLRDQGIEAWTVGRDLRDDGRWFEVRAGAAATREELAGVAEELRALGFVDLEADDRRTRVGEEVTDFSDYRLFGYQAERIRPQLGPALHDMAAAFPCHPRFELVSFDASWQVPELTAEMRGLLRPEGLHEVVDGLAASDLEASPVLGRATYRDLVSGVELAVDMVWRTPLPDPAVLGETSRRLDGPGYRWLSRPLADPGWSFADGLQPVWLAWTEAGERVAMVHADSEAAWQLVPELFDRELCEGGVFSSAALWRPLGVLPASFEPGDTPVAVGTGILGDDYVASKGGARWARRMKGRWSYNGWFVARDEDLWTASVFDLETSAHAADVHGRLYGGNMNQAWSSRSNEWAKDMGWDAVYRTRVRGVPAWYVDMYRLDRHKELNFHEGPFIFAFGSWVLDPDPLLMDDMVDRAARLPLLGGW